MFWTGLIIGLFLGANIGLIVCALIASKNKNDSCKTYDSEFSQASICCL